MVVGLIALFGEYNSRSAWAIWLIGAAKAIESLSDIIYGLWQKEERMNLIALSMIIKGGVSLLAIGGLLWLTGELLWGITGLLGAWLVVAMLFDVLLWQRGGRLRPCWMWPTLWSLVCSLSNGGSDDAFRLITIFPLYFRKYCRRGRTRLFRGR
ncbi:MAG: hypothetical protein IPL28_24570 [Chloroflexi bacterium]|nr:hypothetical protein [Chloroflexota bacterium]